MSEVNRLVYPAGTTSLHGLEVCSYHLNHFLDDEPWDDSIAIAQSMSERAPFNVIDFITTLDGGLTFTVQESRREVQKIALAYIGSGTNFGLQNQYYNGSVNNMHIGDVSGVYYIFATLRKTGRSSFVQSCQNHYRPAQYDILTGADLQSILGVICVGYDDGLTMSSLKYYLDHKDDPNFTLYPSSIFMIGLYGNIGDSNARRGIAPIDLSEAEIKFWNFQDSSHPPSTASGNCYQAFPWAVSGSYTCIDAGTNPLKTPIENPALIFPLIGCINGNKGHLYTWAQTPPANGSQTNVIFGGGIGTIYTPYKDGSFLKIHLLPAAFDHVFSTAATYGIPFTTEFPADAHSLFTTKGITTYMPIANAGGYYDGRFETLTIDDTVCRELSPANRELWEGGIHAPYNGRSYDPNIPIPTDNIDLTQPTMTAIDAFNRTYIIDGNSVDDLGALLWSGDQSFLDSVLKSFELYGEKPINGIINLMLFPFDVREKTGATGNETIKIGRYDTQIAAYRLPTNASAIYDFGSFKWEKEFDNFLDFEPFTTAELYVPFFGMFPLQNSHFIGKTIDIKVAVDFITGAATCIIYVSDKGVRHPVIYKNATLGIQIPVTGDDVSGRVNTILNNAMGVVPDVADMAKSAVTKDIGGLAKSAISAEVHSFGADAVPTMYQTAGASTPECSLYLPKKPYIILYIPEIITSDNYNNCIGYATFEDVTIGNCHGFCKFDNIDLSNIIATDTEKAQILSALTGGVYL